MSGPVDVLAVMEDAARRIYVSAETQDDNDASDALLQARAAVAELIKAAEVAQGDLHMLKKAIEARDPWPELLIRATDAERDLRAALANVGPQS